MNGLVVYEELEAQVPQMREYLARRNHMSVLVLRAEELDEQSLAGADAVAVEWAQRRAFLRAARRYLDRLDVVFFQGSFIYGLEDRDTLTRLMHKAVSSGNWAHAKAWNELLQILDVAERRVVLSSLPTGLQLETTDVCNARCIMCSHAYMPGSGADLLDSGVLEHISDVLPFVRTMVLHGNGEPFLNPKIPRYLDEIAVYGAQFITNTNLSVLTDAILEHLSQHFVQLNVSCDGDSRNLYEGIRVGLNFDRFVANARRVRESCPNLTMSMQVVVMRQNLDHLCGIVTLANELGFDEVVFNQLCTDSRNHNLGDAPYLFGDRLRAGLDAAEREGERCGIRVVSMGASDTNDEGSESQPVDSSTLGVHSVGEEECRLPGAQRGNWRCNGVFDWLVGQPYVNLRGDIAPCCIKQMTALGNVFDESFATIWNNEEYQKLRSIFYEHRMPSMCRGCDFVLHDMLDYLNAPGLPGEYGRKGPR